MTKNKKVFNLFSQTWRKLWPTVDCFLVLLSHSVFAFKAFTVFTPIFQKLLSGSDSKQCHKSILVPNLSSLGTNNLSRKGLIMPG